MPRVSIISNAIRVTVANDDGSFSNVNGSNYGMPVTFAATVQSAIGHAPPTGSFTFYDGDAVLVNER